MKFANVNSFFGKLITTVLSQVPDGAHQKELARRTSIENDPKHAHDPAVLPMKNHLPISHPAPDFSLTTPDGRTVRLSEFAGNRNVLLVFNRGFM